MDLLDTLNKLYLTYLAWKHNYKRLFEAKDLLKLEPKLKQSTSNIDYATFDLKFPHTYEELPNSFLDTIKEKEAVKLVYSPSKFQSIIFTLVFMIVLVCFDIVFIQSLGLFLLFLAFTFFAAIIMIKSLRRHLTYVFTSEKLIKGTSKKVDNIPYENMIAIFRVNKPCTQRIEIHLKDPLVYGENEKDYSIWIKSPKKSNLFDQIINLRKSKLNQ